MIHTDFDPEKTAVIEPSEFYHPMENMPVSYTHLSAVSLSTGYAPCGCTEMV